MARATFVKSAQKNIYTYGKMVEYVSEKGKRQGQTLSKIDKTVPRDENDPILIAKGESYYWWQFKNSSRTFSKTAPKASQLTQSNYLSQLYDLQDTIDDFSATDEDGLGAGIEDLKERIEALKDECQESLDNMPEHLQESSSSGELLNERIETLDNAYSELDYIDCSYDEPSDEDIKQEVAEDNDIDTDVDGWEDEITEEQINEKKEEKLQEWLDEKIEEIQSISLS